MPAGVDDFRVGQYRVDEPDQGKVVGHLVDKVRRAFHPVHAGHVQVVLAEAVEVARLQLAQHLWVAHAVSAIAVQGLGQAADVGQFAGAFHLAVAGDDLLHQGRARAGHAENKYG